MRTRESLLADVRALVLPHLRAYVDDFYASLSTRPGPAEVVSWLNDADIERLKLAQVRHLDRLLSPDLEADVLAARSREIGLIHAMSGVEIEWYVDAMSAHVAEVLRRLDGFVEQDRTAAHLAVNERLMGDLRGALRGFRDLDASQSRVLGRVAQVTAEARTVPDLARGVLRVVTRLDGLVTGFFGRSDSEGRLTFEVGEGKDMQAFVDEVTGARPPTITAHLPPRHGLGPTGRAWRSGSIERSDTFDRDPTTAPWHGMARELGLRSVAAVPLSDDLGMPRAMLTLYSRWPGYFASEGRQLMLEQLRRMVEHALLDLGSTASLGAAVRPIVERSAHLRRLERGEVEMVFQPMVELSSGRVTKLEALARLVDGDRLASPAEFLPAFGEDELVRLFEIGLDQALVALQDWERAGVRVDVSLNLPATMSRDDRYHLLVGRALEKHGVTPERLTLELLETESLGGDLGRRREAFEGLRKLGVRLAQDDLGSGYSSLLRLRHFAFDDVKIDQSLVRGSEVAPRSALHFVRPIADIAHSLGTTVIMEGLETPGLIEAAAQLGVDTGQGYAIARPMPADSVVAFVRDFRLDLDPAVPRTRLGAMGAHVAWEHRAAANADAQHAEGLADCGLADFLATPIDEVEIAGQIALVHEEVHVEAMRSRGGIAHREAWEHLVALIGED
ncbi:MAG: EAL domain-containing protein [Nocardioides sp.]